MLSPTYDIASPSSATAAPSRPAHTPLHPFHCPQHIHTPSPEITWHASTFYRICPHIQRHSPLRTTLIGSHGHHSLFSFLLWYNFLQLHKWHRRPSRHSSRRQAQVGCVGSYICHPNLGPVRFVRFSSGAFAPLPQPHPQETQRLVISQARLPAVSFRYTALRPAIVMVLAGHVVDPIRPWLL